MFLRRYQSGDGDRVRTTGLILEHAVPRVVPVAAKLVEHSNAEMVSFSCSIQDVHERSP